MFGGLHGVFLVYLGLALTWNVLAARRLEGETRRPWEQWLLLPWLALVTAVLVRDRLVPSADPWLTSGVVRHLVPLAFVATLVQNTRVLLRRGVQLTDIPLVLFNVGVGGALCVADLAAGGSGLMPSAAALLHDHSLLQMLLGTHQAQVWTLSWHVPWLLRRDRPRDLLGVVGGLLPATVAAFGAVVLAAFHPVAREVQTSFAREPTIEARPATPLGIWWRADLGGPAPVSGELDAWVLPADHPGTGLPPRGERPLVIALRAPDAWWFSMPGRAEAEAAFLDGAERLAERLAPDLLLPFPEPDGEGTLVFGADDGPDVWGPRVAEAAARVRAVSPTTRVGLRLWGHGGRSRELFDAVAPALDVAGPRLQPGGSDRGGAAFADEVLEAWQVWRGERSAAGAPTPELWVLAAGLSPLAHGEEAQSRFLEGCLARAGARPEVAALLVDGWRDRGHTLGLLRPDGRPRRALQRLTRLVGTRSGPPGSRTDSPGR